MIKIGQGSNSVIYEGQRQDQVIKHFKKPYWSQHDINAIQTVLTRVNRPDVFAGRMKKYDIGSTTGGGSQHRPVVKTIVMDKVQGQDCTKPIQRNAHNVFLQTLRACANVLTGLDDLAREGYVHGDVSVYNLMMNKFPDGTVSMKLIDYDFTSVRKNTLNNGIMTAANFVYRSWPPEIWLGRYENLSVGVFKQSITEILNFYSDTGMITETERDNISNFLLTGDTSEGFPNPLVMGLFRLSKHPEKLLLPPDRSSTPPNIDISKFDVFGMGIAMLDIFKNFLDTYPPLREIIRGMIDPYPNTRFSLQDASTALTHLADTIQTERQRSQTTRSIHNKGGNQMEL